MFLEDRCLSSSGSTSLLFLPTPELNRSTMGGSRQKMRKVALDMEETQVYFASVKARAAIVTCGGLTISGTKIGAETNTVRPQVHDGGSGAMAMDKGQGANKGMSVNEYLVKTLSPEDEGKALSD
ncbi:hypothetical protein Tco_0766340 [Tanacetum coccineum]